MTLFSSALITKKFEELVARHGISEEAADDLARFLEAVAREQFLKGERAGLAYLRRQILHS